MELSRAVYKLGYRKWQYAADECDWLDTTDWKGPMPNCTPECTASPCQNCGCAVGLTQTQLLEACTIAGTDYSSGLANIGLVSACKLLRKHKTLGGVMKAKMVPQPKEQEILKAYLTFSLHIVRNPDSKLESAVQYFNPAFAAAVTAKGISLAFLGKFPPPEVVLDIACAKRDTVAPYAIRVPRDELAERPVPKPLTTADLCRLFGLASAVPKDRKLSRSELEAVLSVKITDVPGADVFARSPTGALLSPTE